MSVIAPPKPPVVPLALAPLQTAPETIAAPPIPDVQSPPQTAPETATHTVPCIIQTNALTKLFGQTPAVQDLTIMIPQGTIFGLIGPSGCGKTTTVRMLTGLVKPTSGEIQVLGEQPTRFRTQTRERIGYMPQQFVLYPQLSVSENMNFVASLYGMPLLKRRSRIKQLLEFVELDKASRRLGNQLSGGMQRRLAVAAALVNDPVLIFADEPTAGIDPVLRAKFWENFRALRAQGRTLFVTTQYVGEAAYCDYVGVMRDGKLIDLDTPENLRRKALGGEVIRLIVDMPHEREAVRRLDALPAIHQVQRIPGAPGQLYVYTDDAATTLPAVMSQLNSDSGIEVQAISKYEPPFDDVFVNLLKQEDNGA